MDYENMHGANITVHSDASLDAFPKNTPGSFTNILKKPLHLTNDDEFVVGVANVHLPKTQYVFVKNDAGRSSITYNLGLFVHDKSLDEWVLLKGSNRELFSYSPIKNINPVLSDSDSDRIYFMKRLSDSLKLTENLDQKYINCHRLFQKTMFHNNELLEHGRKLVFDQCVTCTETVKKKLLNNNELYLTNVFNGYNRKIRDHISLKPLTFDLDSESADFYDSLFNCLEISPNKYFDMVLSEYLEDETMSHALHIILDRFDKYTPQALLVYTWANSIWRNDLDDKIIKPIFAIYTTFGERMSKFLEVDRDCKYFIHSDDLHPDSEKKYEINLEKYNKILSPRFTTPKIDSYFVYSDVVKQSIRLGDSLSNLLSIITVDKSIVNIKNPITTFKPISHNNIYNISIIVTDQFGHTLEFVKNQYAAIELIIKKKE